jgi:hypothetical protein
MSGTGVSALGYGRRFAVLYTQSNVLVFLCLEREGRFD